MKIICFCASQKFRPELKKFIVDFERIASKNGRSFIVLHPEFEQKERKFELAHERDRIKDETYKKNVPGVVYNHLFRKVTQADAVFIFNKDGYIGANTYGELFAAAALGKIIFSLEPDYLMGEYPNKLYEEPSARLLIHDVLQTPKALFEKLK